MAIVSPALQVRSSNPTPLPNNSSSDPQRSFWLTGSILYGWNDTAPNLGPTITVSSGDQVTIHLLSTDSVAHDWYVDANETATLSPDFSSPTKWFNWTITPTIGVNIPHGGDWTYICRYHLGTMKGIFRILPAASFVFTPGSPMVGKNVSFDATASKPSIGGSITSYSWNFGDGNRTSIGVPTIGHTYSSPGRFNVSLSTTDSLSNTDTTSKIVTVSAPGIDLTANLSVDTVLVNSNATTLVTVASNGSFTGMVSLTETSIPSSALACTFYPAIISLGTSGTSSLSCSSSLPTSYNVTIAARSGAVGNFTSVTFSFQDFQITTSTPQSTTPGVSATSTITVTALNGFAGVVFVSETAPQGVLCGAIVPSSIAGGGGAVVSCSASTVGNYTITVTGTGGVSHSSSFVLRVVAATGTSGLSLTTIVEIGGSVGVAIAGVAAALVLLRRKRLK